MLMDQESNALSLPSLPRSIASCPGNILPGFSSTQSSTCSNRVLHDKLLQLSNYFLSLLMLRTISVSKQIVKDGLPKYLLTFINKNKLLRTRPVITTLNY